MRAALVLAAAVGASAASLDSPLLFSRQSADALAGCETQCNPVMDWAFTCRTDVNKCMDQCDAELLAAADACLECVKANNPDEAAKIQARVDPIRQMCGGEADASASGSAASTPVASTSDAAAAPSDSVDVVSLSNSAAAPSDSATAPSGSAAAPSGSAATSSGSASPSASAPATTTSASAAGKVSLSFGAAAAAVAAYLL
ncbi:hypothetical protein CspeluHIS016_0107510 [Cutaneotrichosporon spelunceum]|uniref:Extracellular membrane protein CFEM domain-containing protein n=1 Tax=Cutaneotrichosporon spelunceum TaxID=1672016 RepID=A0AAD3TNY4_9TREE|nr:hypothetical protein CspeluHIS016_0107510 [Cutaneotrichosporon spelunceum]